MSMRVCINVKTIENITECDVDDIKFTAKTIPEMEGINITQTLENRVIALYVSKSDIYAAFNNRTKGCTDTECPAQNLKHTPCPRLPATANQTAFKLTQQPCYGVSKYTKSAREASHEPRYKYPHGVVPALYTLLQDHAKYLLVELTFDIAGKCNNNFACLLVFCYQEQGVQMLLPWHGPTWENLTKTASGTLQYRPPEKDFDMDYKPFVDILSCSCADDATYQQLIDGFVTSENDNDNMHGRQIMSWMSELCQVFLTPALHKRSRTHPYEPQMHCTAKSYMKIFHPGTYTRFAPGIVCIADAQVCMECKLPRALLDYCMKQLQGAKMLLALRELCTGLCEHDRLLYIDIFYFFVMLVVHRISGKYRRDFLGEDIGHISGGIFFADGDCEDKASAFISVVRALEQHDAFRNEMYYQPLQNQVQVFMARGHCVQV
jgi:serine/threonine protein kinase